MTAVIFIIIFAVMAIMAVLLVYTALKFAQARRIIRAERRELITLRSANKILVAENEELKATLVKKEQEWVRVREQLANNSGDEKSGFQGH